MEQEAAKIESAQTFEELLTIMKETTQSIRELRESQKNISKEVGGIANSNGYFAEEYFRNAFEHEPVFAGEHFDIMKENIRVANAEQEDEYDIVLYNKENIAIIETKYKARVSDISDVIKKADSFRQWFPYYKNHNIYLGLAGLTFDNKVISKAKEKGIAIIRQKGGKTIVSDKNLKAY
ncbi:MAG: hypothetical protein FWE63_02145 [Bacteroidales bacterium]|nr:hypothetical protein [Bacteroidales bacterium]